jgi:hypothetical protein
VFDPRLRSGEEPDVDVNAGTDLMKPFRPEFTDKNGLGQI